MHLHVYDMRRTYIILYKTCGGRMLKCIQHATAICYSALAYIQHSADAWYKAVTCEQHVEDALI